MNVEHYVREMMLEWDPEHQPMSIDDMKKWLVAHFLIAIDLSKEKEGETKIVAELQKLRDKAVLLQNLTMRMNNTHYRLVNVTSSQLNDFNDLIKDSNSLSTQIINITGVGYVK